MTLTLRGIAAAPGLAQGEAFLWDTSLPEIPQYSPPDPLAEKHRLSTACEQAAEQLRQLVERLRNQVGDAESVVFEAQAMFLEDSALIGRAEGEIDAGRNAEAAWQTACEYFAHQLETLPDETLRARAADVRDAGHRVQELLLGVQQNLSIERPVILVARDLAPSQTASLDASRILAFCTAEGGPTSHTAILAKARGIPAVVGLGEEILMVKNWELVLVNGFTGAVDIQPDSKTRELFESEAVAAKHQRTADWERAQEPAYTLDGHRVNVVANIGSVEEAATALEQGAEGIGLLRTEFLFINRNEPPDEETQYLAYTAILDRMAARPVVVRTLDIGGDKEAPFYDFGREANPYLGYRAIRISLDHPEDFKVQLRALLRSSTGHALRIMFPMIAVLDEVHQAKLLLQQAREEVLMRRQAVAENVSVGIMVEVPSVAWMAAKFAPYVDFFSIGTNDLTQYTLAAERGNKRLARLSDPCHPAVLRSVESVTTAARREGKWVGVCGEIAGDEDAIPLLIGLQVEELSMAPSRIPRAKQVIRAWSFEKARELALQALEMTSAEEVRRAVKSARS